MGYIAHHALIVCISEYAMDPERRHKFGTPDIPAYRNSLPPEFQPLLIGPIRAAANGDYIVALLPDGSKEGWDTSDEGDRIRNELISMFNFRYDDRSSPFDVVEVRFGGDEPDLAYTIDPRGDE